MEEVSASKTELLPAVWVLQMLHMESGKRPRQVLRELFRLILENSEVQQTHGWL